MIGARAGRAFMEQSTPGTEGLLTWDAIGAVDRVTADADTGGVRPMPFWVIPLP